MTSEQDPQNLPSENYEELEYELGDEATSYYPTEPYPTEPTPTAREEGGEEEEVDKDDVFSRLGESSDDPEQKRRYMEYLALIKDIECQNQMIEDIKTQVLELCAKPCKTKCEIKEIKRLRTCMEQEILKLRCLMEKAMNLQNFGSRRRYQEITIATTIDEDNMAPYVGCIQPRTAGWNDADSSEKSCPSPQDSKDNIIQQLCETLTRMKVCCPEDKKLLKGLVMHLMSKKKQRPPCGPCGPCGSCGPCGPYGPCGPCSPCGPYDPCPPCGPCSPCVPCRPKPKAKPKPCRPCPADGSDECIKTLKQKIACMQMSVNKLKQEICKRCKDKRDREHALRAECMKDKEKGMSECKDECKDELDIMQCMSKRNTKADQIDKLKDNYIYLLTEYARKDSQLKELEKRLKGFCGGCGGRGGGLSDKQAEELKNADQSELILLRVRVSELKEEQVEFKCIMKEQSQQLEDYRNKYLHAQQKVEEQCVTLEKLNMNNKRIEKQINIEVKEIRAKFQEKLNELLHFPKLLENEQIKLAQMCKEKEDLQNKLMLVCKEIKSLKAKLEGPKEGTDCRPQLTKCQLELHETRQQLEEAQRQRDLFCEQLKTTQDDLDTLRSESAKIIARTKERAELTRTQLQEQIDRLEKQLAQCRATACLSVSDREAVIREMQGQLNTLSYSFDAAQKQIKTLRNHIAYVSNENCFPVKC